MEIAMYIVALISLTLTIFLITYWCKKRKYTSDNLSVLNYKNK